MLKAFVYVEQRFPLIFIFAYIGMGIFFSQKKAHKVRTEISDEIGMVKILNDDGAFPTLLDTNP